MTSGRQSATAFATATEPSIWLRIEHRLPIGAASNELVRRFGGGDVLLARLCPGSGRGSPR